MNGLFKLTLLSATLTIVACNEKVAPELKDANASSSTIPTSSTQKEYYFSLTNASNPILNYVVHQTGSGNYNKKCEIRKNIPLSNALYKDGADPESDITCYFEAEELALYLAGLSMKIDAGPNTCEYVAYMPFSYYNRMPGDSTTSLYKVTCDRSAVDNLGILDATDGSDGTDATANLGTATVPVTCNTYVDRTLAPAMRNPFTVEAEGDLCRFNYKDGNSEKCDIGEITLTELSISFDSGTGDYLTTSSTRTISCGGKASECIRGPIKLIDKKSSKFTTFTGTTLDEKFSKTYQLPSLESTDRFPGSWEYVNFRRDLASLNIDYGTSYNTDPITYIPMFSGMKDYSADLMDRYSTNRRMDGSALIDSTLYSKWSYIYDNNDPDSGVRVQKAIPLAAEPFLGMVSKGYSYQTNPFYVFMCMDGAWDIKARIRVVVRDWDRVYSTNSNLELISDINLLTNSRQDILNIEEIPDDGNSWNRFNDYPDWDDITAMNRTPGGYHPTNTIWRPTPLNITNDVGEVWTYSDGYFNPWLFPRWQKPN